MRDLPRHRVGQLGTVPAVDGFAAVRRRGERSPLRFGVRSHRCRFLGRWEFRSPKREEDLVERQLAGAGEQRHLLGQQVVVVRTLGCLTRQL